MTQLAPTSRTKLKRRAQRGSFDRAVVNAILDEGFVCHVSFLHQGKACLIPTVYARAGDWIVLHGSTANRAFRALRDPGNQACFCVTHVDALVMARSAFHHSVNYRSAVIFGHAEPIAEETEKYRALERFMERIHPGRWAVVRPPNAQELKATTVVRIPIVEASAKIRTGGPIDDAEDMTLDVWAGVVPLKIERGTPERHVSDG